MLLGLLHASEKEGSQLYLFDAQLGLPIPGPDGRHVATLAQVAQDDQWLRKLDLDAEHPYPLHAADFEKLTAEIEASPLYLQQRALLVEAKLSGDQKLELSVEPSALAKRLKAIPQIDKAELWPLPFERLKALADRKSPEVKRLATELEPFVVQFPYQKKKDISLVPILWRARVRHLVGDFTGESGANHYYQLVRLPDAEIELATEAHGAELQKITDPQLKAQLAQASQRQLQLLRIVKQDASYWLGLVAFERANYATARDYFEKRTLEPSPDGPWTAGAWYNLGRTYEALGKRKEAIAAYRNDQSPQRHGSMLRARRLEGESPQGESPKADAA
jgi:tetratricopeptide (TPR) repeat protein